MDDIPRALLGWTAGCALIWSALFSIGNFLYGRYTTATALLLAILRVKPAPFCVLDEVDAALDERNVGRFTEALRELTDRTQFIVVTHNRKTIEAADTLYGVSMDEGGSSKVLSMRLADVDERAVG